MFRVMVLLEWVSAELASYIKRACQDEEEEGQQVDEEEEGHQEDEEEEGQQVDEEEEERLEQLFDALVGLLHQLLLGHLLDPHLNMDRIIRCSPVLCRAALCCAALGGAMLCCTGAWGGGWRGLRSSKCTM